MATTRTVHALDGIRAMRLALALAALVGGCQGDRPGGRAADTGRGARRSPPAQGPSRTVPAEGDGTGPAARWIARPDGVGPLRVGMTTDEARAAAGIAAGGASTDSACRYLDLPGLPKRLGVMVEAGIVTRIDVRDTSVSTAEGVHVLSPQDTVLAAYAGRVQVQPHKYSRGWSYLVVRPPGDSMLRIVFEGDGNLVTTYRVGRMPAVAYVEGCS